ncbi:MmgE/PrpD family protein [Pseudonocardia sp. MCCB 268]|nr:MmgE/PrpD family protein [Pseudonocardia cytotoxica]
MNDLPRSRTQLPGWWPTFDLRRDPGRADRCPPVDAGFSSASRWAARHSRGAARSSSWHGTGTRAGRTGRPRRPHARAGDAAFRQRHARPQLRVRRRPPGQLSHPAAAWCPAALAIGRRTILTCARSARHRRGVRTYTRIGVLCAAPGYRRGNHPHAQLAPFGAAAVVAKMRNYDAEQTLHRCPSQ